MFLSFHWWRSHHLLRQTSSQTGLGSWWDRWRILLWVPVAAESAFCNIGFAILPEVTRKRKSVIVRSRKSPMPPMPLHSQMSCWLDLESPVLFLIYRCRWIGQMGGCAGGAGNVGPGKMTGRTVPGGPASQQNQLVAGRLSGTAGRLLYCFGNPSLRVETNNSMQFTSLETT